MRSFLRSRQLVRLPGVQRPLRLQGQVTVEYFLLFAAIALVTILSLTAFDENVRGTLQGFVGAAAARIGTQQ